MGAEDAFATVQGFMGLFLLLHDWVALGPSNDLKGVNSQIPFKRKVWETAINTVPVAVAFLLTLRSLGHPYPTALRVDLVAVYGLFLAGEFRAWWKPYLFGADRKLVERYRAMFSKTRVFLPKRNGIVPTTAHVVLQVCTLLAFLLALSVGT